MARQSSILPLYSYDAQSLRVYYAYFLIFSIPILSFLFLSFFYSVAFDLYYTLQKIKWHIVEIQDGKQVSLNFA